MFLWRFGGGLMLFGLLPVPIFIGEVLPFFSSPGCGFEPRFLVFFGWALPFLVINS